MFDAIGAFFNALWSACKGIWQSVWDILVKGWTWAVGLIVLIVGCVTQVVNAMADLLENVAAEVGSLTAPDHHPDFSAATDFLATANHFFPVQETFALMMLLSVTWLIMLSYRLVKSWLPTLS